MEEIKAYIESGVLELYVLGQLNASEEQEVLAMANQYPEVRQEIEAIEIAMEKYAVQHAIQPAERLEHKIFNHPDLVVKPAVQEAITLPLHSEQELNRYRSKVKSLQYALAGCVALLIGTGVVLYTKTNELGTARQEITSLSLQQQEFTKTVNFMKNNNEELNKLVTMNEDPDWKTIKLAGQKNPSDHMVVYWHPKGKHVMVNSTKLALPGNDADHQYQLWALVDGKPVDLGVFDVKTDNDHILLKMKEIGTAQAFAVTLEKRGGSPTPTMDQMMAMGGV